MSGILFDCDGVLVDSEQWSCGAWVPVLKKHGIDVELADIQVFLGRSDASVLAHYARQTGRSLSDDLIGEKESVYFDHSPRRAGDLPRPDRSTGPTCRAERSHGRGLVWPPPQDSLFPRAGGPTRPL